jgi:hypothetical protein
MVAAGDDFIPSSLPNKMWCRQVGFFYFRLPTYQNGDENP